MYFPVRFRNDEHSGGPVASCGCPSPMFLVCYKKTKLPVRWCPSFVLLLGSRKKNWPALSHCHQASSDSEAPSRVCLSCSCLMAHRKHSEAEQEVVRTSCCPQRQGTPYIIYFFHLRPPSIIPEPSNILLEI